jgi:hypothetical protein
MSIYIVEDHCEEVPHTALCMPLLQVSFKCCLFSITGFMTEQVDLGVTLWTCIQEVLRYTDCRN